MLRGFGRRYYLTYISAGPASTSAPPATTNANTAVAVGVGEEELEFEFGSDCCEKHLSALRIWQQNKRKRW
jgi:hypothetical protein